MISSCLERLDDQPVQAEEAMSAVHRNLRMENQLIVDLIYTFLVRVSVM